MPAAAVRALSLELDTFEGPFDLLLTLILRHELPLPDVEIAGIVLAFLDDLEARAPDSTFSADQVEACGEFLVLVAALLELKARELLDDRGDIDVDELDPEAAAAELAERLEAYRRFRSGASWLASRLEEQAARFFRVGPAPLAPRPVFELARQQPEQLAAVIRSLAADPPEPSLAHLALRLPPLEPFFERFRTLLRKRTSFSFDDEVEGLSRLEIAVAFVALLDLHRQGGLRIDQPVPLGPITVHGRE